MTRATGRAPYAEAVGHIAKWVLSSHPLPPLAGLQLCRYPAGLDCAPHRAGCFHACLVFSGSMRFQECGQAPLPCAPGTMILIPGGCLYEWAVDTDTTMFQCLHRGFSSHEHGPLAALFGSWRQSLETIAVGEGRALEFQRQLEALANRQCQDCRHSTATFELFADIVERFDAQAHDDSSVNAALARCVYHIERNLARGVSVAELARLAHLSPRRLFQLFQERFAASPMQHLANRKADAAKRLLATTPLSICEIAAELGFNSTNYFVRFFKKQTGATPAAWRATTAAPHQELV